MILTCPSCASRYVVDAQSLGAAGRTVRCSRCKTSWHVEASAEPLELKPAAVAATDTPAADLPGEALPKRFRARAQAEKQARKAAAAGAVWGGMAACLAALLTLAILFRTEVAHLWPKTASVYAAVNLPVNVVGLSVEELHSSPAIEDGRQAVVVTGVVRNVGHDPVHAPPMRIDLLDDHGARLTGRQLVLGGEPVPAGQARPFTVSLYDPPAAAAQVEAGFALGGRKADGYDGKNGGHGASAHGHDRQADHHGGDDDGEADHHGGDDHHASQKPAAAHSAGAEHAADDHHTPAGHG